MEAEIAIRRTRQALRRFMPEARFRLIALKPPLEAHNQWVFRCKMVGAFRSVICKVGRRRPAAQRRLARQFDAMDRARSHAQHPRFGTPQPLAFYEDGCALIMQDCQGLSLTELMSGAALAQACEGMERAGAWLSWYHGATQRVDAFRPEAEMALLARRLDQVDVQGLDIPRLQAFRRAAQDLAEAADQVAGRPARLCVPHGDFHPRNILFGDGGTVWGLDFDRVEEEPALRDIAGFVIEAALEWRRRHGEDAAGEKALLQAFDRGYGAPDTASEVRAWGLRHAALMKWSHLGAEAGFTAARRARFEQLRAIVETGSIGAD